jgi:hypothetical protein
MHGDGLKHKTVPWPVLDDQGVLLVEWIQVVGRRFWCPICGTTVGVWPPGLRRGARFGAAVICALLRVIIPMPLGAGGDDAEAHKLVHDQALPPSERSRTGRPRWSSLRRWLRGADQIWPGLDLPGARIARLNALMAAFGAGAPLREVLDAAVLAHLRGGRVM